MDWEDYNAEKEIEIARTAELIEDGIVKGHNGDVRGATHLFMRAIEIYLNAGLYLRISPVFNQLISFVQKETEILMIMDKVQDIIVELDYLDLQDEIAKLRLVLADLLYKQENYLDAANLYVEVADIFLEIDPDEYRTASTMFLLRAGECFEKIGRLERAEAMIFQAVQRVDTTIFDYPAHFGALEGLIAQKKYGKAVEELREIAGFFRKLEKQLENVEEFNEGFANLKQNVLARLVHMVSEFNFLKMVCLYFMEEGELVREQAAKSITDLKLAISIAKEEFAEERYTTADLHRVSFDIFLLQLFQEFADYQVEDPIDLALRGVPASLQAIIRKMSFFKHTQLILEVDLRHAVDIFDDLPLSQILDPFRDFLIQAITSL